MRFNDDIDKVEIAWEGIKGEVSTGFVEDDLDVIVTDVSFLKRAEGIGFR
jgi:hypothetical protein